MKKLHCLLFLLVALMTIPLVQPGTMSAQQAASMQVAVGAICRDVVDRAPIEVGSSFDVSAGKLYCFTKITGAPSPTQITHVWYFGDSERARVKLAVNAATWRTWSSKIIQAQEIGPWHVDVLGPAGEVLQTLDFAITQ
jgi:hypothetical protein